MGDADMDWLTCHAEMDRDAPTQSTKRQKRKKRKDARPFEEEIQESQGSIPAKTKKKGKSSSGFGSVKDAVLSVSEEGVQSRPSSHGHVGKKLTEAQRFDSLLVNDQCEGSTPAAAPQLGQKACGETSRGASPSLLAGGHHPDSDPDLFSHSASVHPIVDHPLQSPDVDALPEFQSTSISGPGKNSNRRKKLAKARKGDLSATLDEHEKAFSQLEAQIKQQHADLVARREALATTEANQLPLNDHESSADTTLDVREREVREKETVLAFAVEKHEAREKALREREAREGTLAEREKTQRDKAAYLALREEQMSLKEKELNDKMSALAATQSKCDRLKGEADADLQKLRDAQQQLTKDAESLTEREENLTKRETEVRALSRRVEDQLAELNARQDSLTASEQDFRMRDGELCRRERELEAKLADADARLARLDALEQQHTQQGLDLQLREATLADLRKRLEEREEDVGQTALKVAAKEADLQQREEKVEEDQQQMQYDFDSLAERMEEVTRTEAEAKAMMQAAVQKSQGLERWQSELQNLQATLEQSQATATAKKAELSDWERRLTQQERILEGRVAECETTMKTMQEREESLAAQLAGLRGRETDAEARLAAAAQRAAAAVAEDKALQGRAAQLSKAELKLKDDQTQLALLEKKLAGQEEALAQAQAEHSARSAEQQRQGEQLRELEEASRRRMAKAKALESQVNKVQEDLKDREADVEAWKATLARREIALEERETALRGAGLQLDDRLRELQGQEQELQEQAEVLRASSAAMLDREAAVLRGEERLGREWPELLRRKEEVAAREAELVQWMKEMEWRERFLEEAEMQPQRQQPRGRRKAPQRNVEANAAFGQALISVQLMRLQQSYVAKAQGRRRGMGGGKPAPYVGEGKGFRQPQEDLLAEVEGMTLIGRLDAGIKAKVGFIRRMWARAKMWEAEQAVEDPELGACRIFTGGQRREVKSALEREGMLRAEDEFLREFALCPVEKRSHYGTEAEFGMAIELWWYHVKAKVLERIVNLVETRSELIDEAVEIMNAKKEMYPELFQDRPAHKTPSEPDARGPPLGLKATQYMANRKVKAEPLFKTAPKHQTGLQQYAKDVAAHSMVPDLSSVQTRYQMYGPMKSKSLTKSRAMTSTGPAQRPRPPKQPPGTDSDEAVSDGSGASSVADYLEAALQQGPPRQAARAPPRRRAQTQPGPTKGASAPPKEPVQMKPPPAGAAVPVSTPAPAPPPPPRGLSPAPATEAKRRLPQIAPRRPPPKVPHPLNVQKASSPQSPSSASASSWGSISSRPSSPRSAGSGGESGRSSEHDSEYSSDTYSAAASDASDPGPTPAPA